MKTKSDIHQQFKKMLDHFAHVLPAQASIRDFVHHNTLHGFEHLKFPDALSAANKLTGAYAYWSKEKFRAQYLKGRINDADLDKVLLADQSLMADDVIASMSTSNDADRQLSRKDVYRAALIYPLKKITACQLKWKVEEGHAFSVCQSDISANAKQQLLASADVSNNEAVIIRELWEACIDLLGLDDALLHPEQMKELSPVQAEKIMQSLLAKEGLSEEGRVNTNDKHFLTEEEKKLQEQQQKAWDELSALTENNSNEVPNITQQNSKLSLRNLIKTLTGVDIDKSVVTHTQSAIDPLIRNESWRSQNTLFGQVGDQLTLRSLLKKLTNSDIQQQITPSLQRFIANWLDEGFSAWNSQDKRFYHCWKESAASDKNWLFDDMPEWQQYIDSLPENSTDAVIAELTRMDIPKNKWTHYLERLALELPGWSGMFYWHKK